MLETNAFRFHLALNMWYNHTGWMMHNLFLFLLFQITGVYGLIQVAMEIIECGAGHFYQ